jgi:uncharacterized phage protein (TIGR01671 family)
MREIKFRVWAKGQRKMFYDGFTLNPDGKISQTWGIYEHNLEIMQFTGLLDKNGKEIYEGDIFSIAPDAYHKYTEINVVEYSEGIYLLEDHGLYLSDYNSRGEVIGNIYENKELLEG